MNGFSEWQQNRKIDGINYFKSQPTLKRIGEHGWNRTSDNLIKSQVLYRLSYVLGKDLFFSVYNYLSF